MRTRRLQSSGNPVKGITKDGHRSVLLQETIDSLALSTADVVIDATLGAGGHSKEILTQLGKKGMLIGFDADKEAIERTRASLPKASATIHLIHANFRTMKIELAKLQIPSVTKILFDLGWSGYQLSAGRGFSFQSDEPLGMAYDGSAGLTAGTIVNEWSEENIADVLYGWGEERYSRRIAKAIVESRSIKSIATARELADIIKASVPAAYRFGKTHPATKSFQALRIAVNDELGALEEGLRAAWELLAPGGRISVISFHSIEDRIVKRQFVEWKSEGKGELITRKPVIASDEELVVNPRARSAKLRVIQKI